MSDPALTQAEFAALLDAIGGFEIKPLLAVGVSGGPDSLALVILADRWARECGGEVVALHVDHRLRPESGEETDIVVGWLSARGIRCCTLIWEGVKPDSGIQAAARDARYALLADWCRQQGCLHLLTGHQRDDQIETHLIRRRAGSGPDGLAGISAIRELPGCRLIRPLLSVLRIRLAAFLETAGQPFLRDPSNVNPAYERARLRASLAVPHAPFIVMAGLDPAISPDRPGDDGEEAMVAVASHTRALGLQRIERDTVLNDLLAHSVALHPAGFAVIDPNALPTKEPDLVETLLARVVGCIGGGRYQPRRERGGRLRVGLAEDPARARTLGGCRIAPWRGRWLVIRELAAAAPPAAMAPGAGFPWDHRFWVDLAANAERGFTVNYLGNTALPRAAKRGSELPGLVRSTLPAFFDEDGLASVPHLGYRRAGAGSLPAIAFRPANPLARPAFTVV